MGTKTNSKYYHVCADGWDGEDLESLYTIYGEKAYDMFQEKWPETGDMCFTHAHMVHMHLTLDDAVEYQGEYGGEIVEISTEDLDIIIDYEEYPHPVTKNVPKEYIKKI